MGGRVPGQQRGHLLLRARPPQAAQQAGHAVRVIEGDVGGGPVRGAGVCAQAVRRIGEPFGGAGVTAAGGGVLVQLGGGPVQAAADSGGPERGLVARRGAGGSRRPELRRGDQPGAAGPAMLVQPVREPVRRPAGLARQAGSACGIPGRPGRAGRAGAGADAGQRPAGPLARVRRRSGCPSWRRSRWRWEGRERPRPAGAGRGRGGRGVAVVVSLSRWRFPRRWRCGRISRRRWSCSRCRRRGARWPRGG